VFRVALNLEETEWCDLLVDATRILKATRQKTTGRLLSVPVGRLSVAWSILGEPLDGKETSNRKHLSVGKNCPGYQAPQRQSIVQTGIMAIDAMIPIGRAT